jgi:hypothetical protein
MGKHADLIEAVAVKFSHPWRAGETAFSLEFVQRTRGIHELQREV